MSETINIHGAEAIAKIKELAEKERICMFATALNELPLSVRPMSTSTVEEDGAIWFFSQKDSVHNAHIIKDNRVQLFYSNTASEEYLSLFGHAEITTDRKKIEELWNPIVKVWFNEGKDDPNISLIKVVPAEGYYWDTKHQKIIQMAKIMFGALTGMETDDGLEGKVGLK